MLRNRVDFIIIDFEVERLRCNKREEQPVVIDSGAAKHLAKGNGTEHIQTIAQEFEVAIGYGHIRKALSNPTRLRWSPIAADRF